MLCLGWLTLRVRVCLEIPRITVNPRVRVKGHIGGKAGIAKRGGGRIRGYDVKIRPNSDCEAKYRVK